MRASYQWLRQYASLHMPAEELAERLTAVGLPCEKVEPFGDDWVLDIEIPSNRPDCLGMIGLAREAAVAAGCRLELPRAVPVPGPAPASSLANVGVEDRELCPRYVARVLTDLRVGESPEWMCRRLEAVGLRALNSAVDITNYVLFETGQPLHAFDLDKLAGGGVAVRRARPGEKIDLLDGSARELSGSELVIADGAGPVALAGIMGGQRTAVGPQTTRVLLESAAFHAGHIRRTSRALALATESSYRFERGVDQENVDYASCRAACLMEELCAAAVAAGSLDTAPEPPKRALVTVRYWRVDQLLGMRMEKHVIRGILLDLGLQSVYEAGEGVTFQVPAFRPDLTREIDLIEEVARHWGYDKVPSRTALNVALPQRSVADQAAAAVRQTLARRGFSEAVTVSIVPREQGRAVRPWRSSREMVLTNPPKSGQDLLRQSLLPSLLEVRRVNQAAQAREVQIFEIGRAYLCAADEKVVERRLLAAMEDRPDLDGAAPEEAFAKLRAASEAVLDLFGARATLRVEPAELPYMAPGESAKLFSGDQFIGVLGRLSAGLQPLFDLHSRPAMLEMDLDALVARGLTLPRLSPLPRFPAVRRDAALVLDESVTFAQVAAAAAEAACPMREALRPHSVYRGKPVPAGRKSMAVSVTYRAPDRTLTDEEVNRLQAELVKHLEARLGARVRE